MEGRPAAELTDDELEQQGTHAHATRNWVFLHGTASQYAAAHRADARARAGVPAPAPQADLAGRGRRRAAGRRGDPAAARAARPAAPDRGPAARRAPTAPRPRRRAGAGPARPRRRRGWPHAQAGAAPGRPRARHQPGRAGRALQGTTRSCAPSATSGCWPGPRPEPGPPGSVGAGRRPFRPPCSARPARCGLGRRSLRLCRPRPVRSGWAPHTPPARPLCPVGLVGARSPARPLCPAGLVGARSA